VFEMLPHLLGHLGFEVAAAEEAGEAGAELAERIHDGEYRRGDGAATLSA